MSRDHKAAYQRRNKLAQQRGFESYAQQRRHSRIPVTEDALKALPDSARSSRAEALDVINAARREHRPLTDIAAERGVPLSTVAWWGAPALEAPASRAPGVRKADRLLRAHPLIVEGELRIITTRGSNAARRAQQALRVQRAFLDGEPGSADALAALSGARVGGFSIETDPEVISEIGRRGELGDIAETYRAYFS